MKLNTTFKIHVLHDELGYPHGINVYPSPFHAHEGTLNTICSEKKSKSRVEVYYPLAASIEQVFF